MGMPLIVSMVDNLMRRRSLMSRLAHLLHRLRVDNLEILWRTAIRTGVLFKHAHILRDDQLEDVKNDIRCDKAFYSVVRADIHTLH